MTERFELAAATMKNGDSFKNCTSETTEAEGSYRAISKDDGIAISNREFF